MLLFFPLLKIPEIILMYKKLKGLRTTALIAAALYGGVYIKIVIAFLPFIKTIYSCKKNKLCKKLF